ncbi:MAG: vWA domain-containing protein [Chloroflexota bacterium]
MNRRIWKMARYVLLVALLTGTGVFAFGFLPQNKSTALVTDTSPGIVATDSRTGSAEYLYSPAEPSVSGRFEPNAPTGSGMGSAKNLAGEPVKAPDETLHGGTGYAEQQQQTALTAGQVDDNAKYQEYLQYLKDYASYNGPVNTIDVSQRLFVHVLDGAQMPVAGARVQLYDGDRSVFVGETMSDGRVMFLPKAAGIAQPTQFRAVISRGQANVEATVAADGPEQVVTLAGLGDKGNEGAVGVDLVFLLDATGSMADEIDHIKQTVGSIAQRIEQLPGSSAPRFGLVAYRDRGDDYVTRQWDFTLDIGQFSANLATVEAGGGGDIPESVNAGLHDAIHLQGWADNSTGRHLRMIVLVGDAPPHLNYANDYNYPQLLNEAAANGIKIFPVGASNLEADGEYIFRQFAQVTQGQFVFLTYANGVSGAPGSYTDKHVSDFTVQNLDSLIVGLVAGEISNQTGQQVDTSGQVVPAVPVVVPASVVDNGRIGMLGRSFGGNGAIFWSAIVSVVLVVLYATRREGRERTPSPAGEEIFAPESDIENEAGLLVPARLSMVEQPEEDRELIAAHMQPSFAPVELRVEVQPTQRGQGTRPL